MAGVSYDIIDELQLTNVNNLIGYDALIFPAMTDVNTAQLPAIMSALTSAVYDYHIPIITSGDFLTNDQTGAPLAGNPYVNMETLLGLNRVGGGNSGNVSVTANDLSNPAMKSYTAGQVIQTYTGVGYTDYEPVGNTPKDVLVNQSVTDPTLAGGSETIPGVTETTVGGTTNVEFASQALLGDSNLLSNVIQSVVLGTTPGVALHTSRDGGIVAARMDMDQAQVPADVSPAAGGPGIYDQLIPILQQWKAQYNFVGSYYVDIGDNPTPAAGSNVDPTTTTGRRACRTISRSWRWAARSARTPTPISSTRPPRRSQRTPSAPRRRARPRSPSTRCRRSTASRWACGSPARVSARTRRYQAPPAKAVRWPTRRSSRSPETPSPSATYPPASAAPMQGTIGFHTGRHHADLLRCRRRTPTSWSRRPAPTSARRQSFHLRLRVRQLQDDARATAQLGAWPSFHDLRRRRARRGGDRRHQPEHHGLFPLGHRLHRLCHRRLDRHRLRLPERVRLHQSDAAGVRLYRART